MYDTIKLLRKQLDERGDDIALIGFTGAPWTLATYMIEGQGTKHTIFVKNDVFKPCTFT